MVYAAIVTRLAGFSAGVGSAVAAASYLTDRAADGHERAGRLLGETEGDMVAELQLVSGRIAALEAGCGIPPKVAPKPAAPVAEVAQEATA